MGKIFVDILILQKKEITKVKTSLIFSIIILSLLDTITFYQNYMTTEKIVITYT